MIDAGNRCDCCGNALSGRLFRRQSGTFCCEACVLDKIVQTRRSDTSALLAETLIRALDLREHETGLHSQRVACHTQVLARRFSADPEFLHQVYWGALLHDLGKIGISDAILLKAGPLNEAEWSEMRTHPRKGHELLAAVPGLAKAAELVLTHEERFDGGGYPAGLKGEAIPLGARLFAVIDTLDAMTSDRPYRRACGYDEAAREIVAAAGGQFDPQAVAAFCAEAAVLREMVEMKCTQMEMPA